MAQQPGRRRVGSCQQCLRVEERERQRSPGAHLEKQRISHVVQCKNVLCGCFSCLGTWCVMVPLFAIWDKGQSGVNRGKTYVSLLEREEREEKPGSRRQGWAERVLGKGVGHRHGRSVQTRGQ